MQLIFAILPLFINACIACTPPMIMLEVQPTENSDAVTFPVPMYTDCTLTVPKVLPAGQGLSPLTLENGIADYTQFVGPDGLALDTESLSQILEIFGGQTEGQLIKQVKCRVTFNISNLIDDSIDIVYGFAVGAPPNGPPLSVNNYTCYLPTPAKPGFTKTIPGQPSLVQVLPSDIVPVAIRQTDCTPPNIMLEVQPAPNAKTVTFPAPMYFGCDLKEPKALSAGQGLSPTTLATAVGDFTQFVGPDGLALDTESLNQILQAFGVETEDEVIKQAVCTFSSGQVQGNITAQSPRIDSSSSERPVEISSYTCSLPIHKLGLTETIPVQSIPSPPTPNGIVPVAISRRAPKLITAVFFDTNEDLITQFKVGIALQQDLTLVTDTLNGQNIFFMNVGNADDLVQVSVCAGGMRSQVNFDAFGGGECRNIGGIPCPLSRPGVITAISVAGPGVQASISCAT